MNLPLLLSLIALVAGPAFADSGSGGVSALPTDNGVTFHLSGLSNGPTRLRLHARSDYTQAVALTNYSLGPVVGQTVFGNSTRLIYNGQTLARSTTRAVVPLYCDALDSTSGWAGTTLTVDAIVNVADLGPQPWSFTVANNVRTASFYTAPLGGAYVEQRTSQASIYYEWEQLP